MIKSIIVIVNDTSAESSDNRSIVVDESKNTFEIDSPQITDPLPPEVPVVPTWVSKDHPLEKGYRYPFEDCAN